MIEKRLEANGQVFPYLTGGTGEPLVLLHGFTANKDNFNALSRHLTPHYTVYTPDWPGFGDSSRAPNADYGSAAQIEHRYAFVNALGLRKFHLVGSSMGALLLRCLRPSTPNWLSHCALSAPQVRRNSRIRHWSRSSVAQEGFRTWSRIVLTTGKSGMRSSLRPCAFLTAWTTQWALRQPGTTRCIKTYWRH